MMPSAIVDPHRTDTGRPFASDGGYAAAACACTPTIRTSGRSALTATPMPGREAAASHADDDRPDLGALLQDLRPTVPLPGDDVGVVEGVDEHRAGVPGVVPAPRPASRPPPDR